VLLTRLGVPWLWGADVEKGWVFMRFNVVPITTRWLAPDSYCYGLDRLPKTGGAVFAMNHLSAIDPPLVGSFSNRAIWYMTKSELLEIPIVGEALTWAGGFPIRRGESDREGLRKARELVREGHVVGVFVEGTRQRFGYPGEVHPRRAHDRDEGGRPRDPVRARIVRMDALEPTSVLSRLG
jgi:1-acyl-sn-glycerol-3-phosphate acyltransferase